MHLSLIEFAPACHASPLCRPRPFKQLRITGYRVVVTAMLSWLMRMSSLFHTHGQFSQHAKDMRIVTLCVNHSVDATPATRVSNRIFYHNKCASRFSWAPCRTKGTAKRNAQRNQTFEPIGALRAPPARPQAVLSIHTLPQRHLSLRWTHGPKGRGLRCHCAG